MTTADVDRIAQWVKDNPDRVLHRSTGEGPCKEAELEALLKEAKGLLEVALPFLAGLINMRLVTPTIDKAITALMTKSDSFFDRPDVKRWTE
jgi:hypothetical protein